MPACVFGGNKPQINADERRYHPNMEAFGLNLEETLWTQLRPSHGKK